MVNNEPGKEINLIVEDGKGKLYESNGFLIPVLTGPPKEMGAQYGALMVEHMQKAYDVLIEPGHKKGMITDADARKWTERAYSSCSTRNRLFYDGVVEGSGWPLDKVGMLDQLMEFGIYQSNIHSFAGCTSILSWGSHSADGGTYIGRNMDWSPAFNTFPTVLTVRRPTDGSYKYATTGWPGMYCAFTALNEQGAYLDVHDGTSMGGSVTYIERPSSLNVISDLLCEAASFSGLVTRLNGLATSTSTILTLGDETTGGAMECSSLAGNRLRKADGDSLTVVNSFLDPDWGLGKRETVSNSLRRYANMTARLAENQGKVNAQVVRSLMDLTLFNADGTFAEKGGATKPTKQDADLTNYQTVVDVKRREMWMKVPSPTAFADWTHFDLKELWG
jgi:hypothetical protein